jgi:hypothetical protein
MEIVFGRELSTIAFSFTEVYPVNEEVYIDL